MKTTSIMGIAYLASAAAGTAGVWCWFLLEQFTDWRMSNSAETGLDDPIGLWVPVATTVVAPIIVLLLWRRAVGIAANGVKVQAIVIAISGEVSSMRDITFGYVFDGKKYKKEMSLDISTADELEAGEPLEIIVDRRNPTRVMVNWRPGVEPNE